MSARHPRRPAARANPDGSYVYDALKAAWYYRFLHNRPSPFVTDKTIQSLLPTTNLPSYPSEDAVLSVVNAELLKLLFPVSAAEITQHETDQQQAALLSGRASASDIADGATQRDEAAMSRLYAGIHYRSDITTGIDHGTRIAVYTLSFAKADGAN